MAALTIGVVVWRLMAALAVHSIIVINYEVLPVGDDVTV